MAELVDAQDLKSCVGQPTCQFDSGSRHKEGLSKKLRHAELVSASMRSRNKFGMTRLLRQPLFL